MKLPSHKLDENRIPSTLDMISSAIHELSVRGVLVEVFSDEDDEWPYVISHEKEFRAQVGASESTAKFLLRFIPMEFTIGDSRTFDTIEELALFLDGMYFGITRKDRIKAQQ